MGRILLVDDDDDGRFAVVEAIRKLTRHTVEEARSGAIALQKMESVDYDLILLDVQMPGLDGLEVCRQLRARPRTATTPVLFLTAKPYQVQSRVEALEIGSDDFIVQPVSNRELVARIEAVIRTKARTDRAQSEKRVLESRVREEASAAATLADELRAERDNLRQTFDVFEEALLLFAGPGELLVANAAGRRLRQTSLASELASLVAEACERKATCDRALSDTGRSYVGRAYPVSGGRVLLYVREVTEEREREVRRLQAEKLASIGMLAAGVAHEINNPAAFVLGNIEALGAQLKLVEERLQSAVEPPMRNELQGILFEITSILQESKEGMARIQRIVRDLSSFSHVDDEKQKLTELNSAVESTLGLLKNELRHRATVERDLRATRVVQTSPARIGQVFLNLIINATQALNESEAGRNRIVVRTYDADPDVVFEVTDNGPGIPPDQLTRIFDSFYTTKPRGVGTGLGLPISQGIVRSLGGEVTVETAFGNGATFRVRLPSLPGLRSDTGVGAQVAPTYRRRRILAVDDEALLLKAYRRMLADVHEIVTALGARDALLILEKNRDFDLVLCDLQMPEISGIELYAAVKARYPELGDRFVFVTGGAFSTEAKRFLEQDITCLGKPFRIEELLATIEQKIGKRLPGSASAGKKNGLNGSS
jgi:signal transduction histidine kinase